MWNKVWVPRQGCRVFFQQKTASFVKNFPWQPGQDDIFMSYPYKLSPSSVIVWRFAWGKRLEDIQCIPENLQVHIALWYCCRSAFSSAGWVTALWRHFGDSSSKDSEKNPAARFPGLTTSGSSSSQNANNGVINRIIKLILWKSHSSSSLKTVSYF